MFEIVFTLNVKDTNIFSCLHNIRLSYNIKKCFSVLTLRMSMLPNRTVNMVVFVVKSNKHTYPKGRSLMQMYAVVPITKKGE